MLSLTELSGFGSGGTSQTPQYVSSSTALLNSSTTVTLTAPAGIQDGDLLIAYLFYEGANTSVATAPAGFVQLFEEINATNCQGIFTKTASSESGSYAFTYAGSGSGVAVMLCYRNAKNVNTVGAVTRASSSTATGAGITPDSAGTLIAIFGSETNGLSVNTPPSGMLLRESSTATTSSIFVYEQEQAATASGDKAAVLSSSTSAFGQLLHITNQAATIQRIATAKTQSSGTGVTTLTINKPTGTQDGDLMIAFVTTTTGESWTGDSGWTEVVDQGTGASIRIAYKVASSEGASYTFTTGTTTNTPSGVIVTYRGATYDTTTTVSTTTDGNNVLSATVTAAVGNSKVIGFGARLVTSETVTSLLTVIDSDNDATSPSWALADGHCAKGATGHRTFNFPGGTAGSAAAVHVVIKPS